MLKQLFGRVASELRATQPGQELLSRLSSLDASVNRLDNTIGSINEISVRRCVEQEHGARYAKPVVFDTLTRLSSSVLEGEPDADVAPADTLAGALAMAGTLCTDGWVEMYLKRLYASAASGTASTDSGLLEVAAAAGTWDGSPDFKAVGRFIGQLGSGHQPLVRTLGLLHSLLQQPAALRPAALLTRVQGGSLGIVLAQFAADNAVYLSAPVKKYKDLVQPSNRLQCDAQGSVELYDKNAVLDVCEIKRNAQGYAEGLEQVEKRLALLEWGVRVLRPQYSTFVKVGRIYMPASNEAQVQQQPQPVGRKGTPIYVHYR